MIEPTVAPRIEQGDNLPRDRIETSQVRTFAEIAAVTGKGQVTVVVTPTMLARYYVLDVMRKGTPVLRKETIFATVPGSGPDEHPRR